MGPTCGSGMRARPFLAVVLAAILTVFGLGLGTAWLLWRHSPLQLAHRQAVVPRAARFVPRQAPLSLHLLSDGEEPLAYGRSVAPPRQRRQAMDTVARLRDGAFAAAGLDYSNELRGWLAPGISFALLDLGEDAPPGWLLALSSRDQGGARRFLQRFWQTRSLAGTDLQVSRYRGMGLISGRGALVGQEPIPLATALIDDGLVLLASGRGVLEQALDVSQIDELNQSSDPAFRQGIEQLGEAALLLQASPGALQRWMGVPSAAAADLNARGPLLASLRPSGQALMVNALLGGTGAISTASSAEDSAPASPEQQAAEAPLHATPPAPDRQALLAAAHGPSSSLALLQDPATLLQSPLLAPLVTLSRGAELHGGGEPSLLPELVLRHSHGALLASRLGDTWQLGSGADDPPLDSLAAPISAAGLNAAPLEVNGRTALVWTRLSTTSGNRRGDRDGVERLQATVEGWRSLQDNQAWWGRSLADLQQAGRSHPDRERVEQLERLGQENAALRWVVDGPEAQQVLAAWPLWRLVNALAGGGLNEPVQGLGLAVDNAGESLRLQARLELG